MYKNSLFCFRQDLRFEDNSALKKAIQNSENIFLVFIFDKNLVSDF